MSRFTRYSISGGFIGFLVWVFLVFMSGADINVRTAQTGIIYLACIMTITTGVWFAATIEIHTDKRT